jgi:CheY-like chemotaxis protein
MLLAGSLDGASPFSPIASLQAAWYRSAYRVRARSSLIACESVFLIASSSCLAGIAGDRVATLGVVLRSAGAPLVTAICGLDVAALGKLAPSVIICDIDGLDSDRLEFLRQVRFVVPECIIAVYTMLMTHSWALQCHLAGANCLLSKESTGAELSVGLRSSMVTGCFTDSRFDEAQPTGGSAGRQAAPPDEGAGKRGAHGP